MSIYCPKTFYEPENREENKVYVVGTPSEHFSVYVGKEKDPRMIYATEFIVLEDKAIHFVQEIMSNGVVRKIDQESGTYDIRAAWERAYDSAMVKAKTIGRVSNLMKGSPLEVVDDAGRHVPKPSKLEKVCAD
tara:strand:+ start:245 stop:643 length:399 start_codon:yes stop_codon:yes gene_type:complete